MPKPVYQPRGEIGLPPKVGGNWSPYRLGVSSSPCWELCLTAASAQDQAGEHWVSLRLMRLIGFSHAVVF